MSNQRVICLIHKSHSPIYTDIENDFVEIATDLEIDHPEEGIIYDSDERVSERGIHDFSNEEDPDSIESANLISCISDEPSNEIAILETANENEQVVSFPADDKVDDKHEVAIEESDNTDQQEEAIEEAEVVEKIDADMEGKFLIKSFHRSSKKHSKYIDSR